MRPGDEEDWVGEPPEGRHSRDRADPGFWHGQRPPLVAGVGITVAVLALVLVLLLA